MIVTYIWNLFSIKYYLVHILAKYWASIAYIKRISTLQTFGHSKLKHILPRVLQYFSLYITLRSFFCMTIYICNTQKHTCIHSNQNTEWCPWLYVAKNREMRKTAALGVGVTLNKPCCHGYQSSGDNIFFKFVFNQAYFLNLFSIKHYLGQLMAEFGASIANIKRLCVLQTFGHLKLEQI